MPQALIDLGQHQAMVLNVIKGKFGFSNKSEAVNFIVQKYEECFLEPELRPEYVEKLKKIDLEKGIKFKNLVELRKTIEN